MSMERIVRPFQRGDVFTARRMVPIQSSAGALSQEECYIEWSGPNSGTYVTEEWLQGGFTVEWDEDKNAREYETVRVENPEDPEQYVYVKRLKKSKFKNQKGDQMAMSWSDFGDPVWP